MFSYHHFTPDEREILLVSVALGNSMRSIATKLNRNVSSISRELKRNQTKKGKYSASHAQKLYRQRRKGCVRNKKLDACPEFIVYLRDRLGKKWSVEAILNRFVLEYPALDYPSISTVYRAFQSRYFPEELRKQLKHKGWKKNAFKTSGNGKLKIQASIHERPEPINQRERIGDWESDTVHGYKHRTAIATHVDRRSRFLVASLLLDITTPTFSRAMLEAFTLLPSHSFTVDRGMEFAEWRRLRPLLGCEFFFCDPASPWQRGTNENTNGLLRRYFPKGFDFRSISYLQLKQVVDQLNDRPRKCLGWLTPREVFFSRPICCT